jgi:transposase
VGLPCGLSPAPTADSILAALQAKLLRQLADVNARIAKIEKELLNNRLLARIQSILEEIAHLKWVLAHKIAELGFDPRFPRS